MKVTKTDMFRGCLIASISHAIMTNVYPDLSYEQSWDGANYSIQTTSGMRGTITFETNYCIGAIRNENSDFIFDGNYIKEHMSCFPLHIACKAYAETLQYLLLEKNGIIMPCVTSIFWADDTAIHFEKRYIDNISQDFILFESMMMPAEIAINKWKEYYDMDSNAIELLNILYPMKEKDFYSRIVLSEVQKQLIPGSSINDECIESLKELNIFLK